MELTPGVCGICNSSSLILDSEYTQTYCDLLYSHFQNELNIPSESKTYIDLCPRCVHYITLIRFKKNLLANQIVDGTHINKCGLCQEDGQNFQIADTNFLDKCRSWFPIEDKISLCASCFYMIDINNELKEHLQKIISKKSPPKIRTILRRRKSTYEVENSSTNEENIDYHEENSNRSSDTTPLRRKGRNKYIEETLNEKEYKIRTYKCLSQSKQTSEQLNFDLSNISHFAPLCKTNINIEKRYKLDDKMYNCVPFVRMQQLEKSIHNDEGNYVCSLVSQRPMIRVKRTPPIKIKALKNLKAHKKNYEYIKKGQSISKIPKQKLVVKVERMKLEISSDEDMHQEEFTPKKKKRVHFNDTPTIIITENDYYDEYRTRRNSRMSPEQPETDEIDIIEDEIEVEEEKSDSEELITLSLEESDDDSNEYLPDVLNQQKGENQNEEAGNQSSEDVAEKNIEKENHEEYQVSENEATIKVEEVLKESDENLEKETELENKPAMNSENEKIINEMQTEETEYEKDSSDDSENSKKLNEMQTEKTEYEEECADNSETGKKLNEMQTEEAEHEKQCADNLENRKKLNEMQTEEAEHEKECADNSENKEQCDELLIEETECENVSENERLKETEHFDNNDMEGKSDNTVEINRTSDEQKEISNLQESSNHLTIEKNSTQETISLEEKEESTDKIIRELGANDTLEIEDSQLKETTFESKDSNADGKIDENLEEEVNKDPSTPNSEDLDTEKDSLDGFEVIDQAEELTQCDDNKKCTENLDEIESLVMKYCGPTDIEHSPPEKENNCAQGSPKDDKSQEENENNSNNPNNEKENEDLGSLIEEAQQCLTTTKDLLDQTEEGSNKELETFEPNSQELQEILNSSFDVSNSDTANALQSNSVDNNIDLKRKNYDDEAEASDCKKQKIDISSA